MLIANLKVVFNATDTAEANALNNTPATDKAIMAIVGQPVSACGWYGGMRELVWSKLPFDSAVVFARKITEAVSTPCSVELATTDPEKWANATFSDAENLLTYKAVRAAVKAGDIAFSDGGEDYEPGKSDPPSDQYPA